MRPFSLVCAGRDVGAKESASDGCRCDHEDRAREKRGVVAAVERRQRALTVGGQAVRS